jgi:hypothetical protein
MPNIMETTKTKPKRSRSTKIAAGVVGTLLAGGALVAGSAAPAAASATVTLQPWYATSFPTWSFGGQTTFCVSNPSYYSSANVRINVVTGAGENVTAGPGQTNCIKRSWWGAPIFVQNVGASTVRVWTY